MCRRVVSLVAVLGAKLVDRDSLGHSTVLRSIESIGCPLALLFVGRRACPPSSLPPAIEGRTSSDFSPFFQDPRSAALLP